VDLVPELFLVFGTDVITEQCLDQPVDLNGARGRVDGGEREASDVPDDPGEHDRGGEYVTQLRPSLLQPAAEYVARNGLGTEESATAKQFHGRGLSIGQLADRNPPCRGHRDRVF